MNKGDIVTAFYKSGKYIGEITGSRPGIHTVKVLAVLRHPVQGDLHNPNSADVDLFHERKALAFREQANMPENTVYPYEGEIPDYFDSLRNAVASYQAKLKAANTPFSDKSIETLQSVLKEYELMYNIEF